MKLSLIFTACLFGAVCAVDYAPFVTLSGVASCSDADMLIITAAVVKASSSARRRGLGASATERTLLTTCPKLMGWATSKCGGSVLKRRQLTGNTTSPCNANIAKFNTTLENVKSKVSSSCQSYIGTRSFECRELVVCDIAKIDAWNGDTDTVERRNVTSTSNMIPTFCSSLEINLQAVTNFDVGHVQYTMTGPNSYKYSNSEWQSPYFLFGDFRGNINGETLEVGTYTLTIIAASSPTKPRTLQFRITRC